MSRFLCDYNINLAAGMDGGWHYNVSHIDDGEAMLIQTGTCREYAVATSQAFLVVQDDRTKHKDES